MTPFKVILFLLVAVVVDVVFAKFQLSAWFFVWSGILMVVFGLLMTEGEEQPQAQMEKQTRVEEHPLPLSPTMYFDQAVRDLGEFIHRRLEATHPHGDTINVTKRIRVSNPRLLIKETAKEAMNALFQSDAPYGLKAFANNVQVEYLEFGYDQGEYLFGEPYGCEIDLLFRFGLPGETIDSPGCIATHSLIETSNQPTESCPEDSVEEEGEEDMMDLPLVQPSSPVKPYEKLMLTEHIPAGEKILVETGSFQQRLHDSLGNLQDEFCTSLEVLERVLLEHMGEGKIFAKSVITKPLPHGVSKVMELAMKGEDGRTVVLCVTIETD